MKDQLKRLDPDAWTFSTVNMNNSMDAPALQVIMEQPLEKKTGRSYGPRETGTSCTSSTT